MDQHDDLHNYLKWWGSIICVKLPANMMIALKMGGFACKKNLTWPTNSYVKTSNAISNVLVEYGFPWVTDGTFLLPSLSCWVRPSWGVFLEWVKTIRSFLLSSRGMERKYQERKCSCRMVESWNLLNNGINQLIIWCRISQPSTVCYLLSRHGSWISPISVTNGYRIIYKHLLSGAHDGRPFSFNLFWPAGWSSLAAGCGAHFFGIPGSCLWYFVVPMSYPYPRAFSEMEHLQYFFSLKRLKVPC